MNRHSEEMPERKLLPSLNAFKAALLEISEDIDCGGPGCPYCAGYDIHPFSTAANIAQRVLASHGELVPWNTCTLSFACLADCRQAQADKLMENITKYPLDWEKIISRLKEET